MSDFRNQAKRAVIAGVKKAGSSFVWICKIIIPVSLLVTLLQWTGWLNQLDFLLNPLMSLLNLPPEAALPIISGMLINIYATLAAVAAIPFTTGQMTLIAIFSLIAHALIMEGVIQHKSGLNAIKATLFRIGAAILTVLIVSLFLGDTSQSIAVPGSLSVPTPFLEVLKTWAIDIIYLLLKIWGIILAIMILQEFLRSTGWLDSMLRFFRPLIRIFGLSERTTMMWLIANIFGLFYGGAVIVEEARKGTLAKEELEHLHISIGINHSVIEDPLLFAILGLNVFWLWLPRFVMAIVVVQTYRAIKYLRSRLLR
ncbi:MAG: iron transporter [Dehalococcoidia bacterium]|nr:MAG: iron transporter [Dehalococcoidia bacterium]